MKEFHLKVENLEVPDLAGCERDGWCVPLVRLRAIASVPISGITFEFWMPPEADNDEEALVIVSGPNNIKTQYVTMRTGEPAQVTIPLPMQAGWDASFMLTSDHLVLNKGDDSRELSFMILAIRGVAA